VASFPSIDKLTNSERDSPVHWRSVVAARDKSCSFSAADDLAASIIA
jgi:hypothetical protein